MRNKNDLISKIFFSMLPVQVLIFAMGFINTIKVIGEILLVVLIFGLPAYLYLTHVAGAKYRKAIFGQRVIKEQSIEIPLNGDFCAAATVASYMYKSDESSITVPVTTAYYLAFPITAASPRSRTDRCPHARCR